MTLHKTLLPLSTALLFITAIILMILIYLDYLNASFFIGTLRFHHILAIIGGTFIAFYTPLFFYSKRHYPSYYQMLLNLHVFGFLISFVFISIHLAGQLSRPILFYPELGEGITLFFTTLLLVITGFIQRFQLVPKSYKKKYSQQMNRQVHACIATAFYIIYIFHVLINFNII